MENKSFLIRNFCGLLGVAVRRAEGTVKIGKVSAASESRLKVAEGQVIVSFGKEGISRLVHAESWSAGATRR